MPKNDKRWMAFEELPEAAKPLALAYNAYFSPLHSTSNVVRLADGGDSPRLFVQHHGRLAPAQLVALERAAGCTVEVEAIAPGYCLIMMWGSVPPGGAVELSSPPPTSFLFRALP